MMRIEEIAKNVYRIIILACFILGIICFCFESTKMAFVGLCFWSFCIIPALIWNAREDYYIEYEGDDNEAAEKIDQR